MLLNDNVPVRLRGREALWLSVKMHFRVAQSNDVERGPWKVRTSAACEISRPGARRATARRIAARRRMVAGSTWTVSDSV